MDFRGLVWWMFGLGLGVDIFSGKFLENGNLRRFLFVCLNF